MADDLNLSMFRAYDIRTPAQLLTGDLAQRLAAAVARYFREILGTRQVLVGHDARRGGPAFLGLAGQVYRRAGLDVIYLPGVCSSSYFYYAAMRHPEAAGVLFGASHNPAGDTGQKIVGPGVEPIAEDIGPAGGLNKIKQYYVEGGEPPARAPGRLVAVDLLADYVSDSMELAGVGPGSLAGVTVLQDYLHGAAGREMMLGFARAGAQLEPLHYTPDSDFPAGDPNPVKRDVVAAGLRALRQGDYTLGSFFDGDGDRMDVYRGDGVYLASSFVYAAILPEIRRRHDGPGRGVFADLKANPLAVIEMARSGVVVDVVRSGHSQIKKSLLNDPQMFGAVEESAHFYEVFRRHGGRYAAENTLYLALLLARVWCESPDRVAQMFALQATTAREREWGYKFPSAAARGDALAAVAEHFGKAGFQSMDRMKNGMDLEATLMRRGLPFEIGEHTKLGADWLQIAQRTSQSESALARWEAVGACDELVSAAKRQIAEIVRTFGAGSEYQG